MIEPLPTLSRFARLMMVASAALAGFLLLPASAVSAGSGQDSYVLFSQGSRSTSMNGSTSDLDRARALRAGREAMLYVRQGGAEYVVRDAATLRRADAIFEPQRAMGARQAELGSRQAALGSRQAALGAQQAALGARQANATPRQAVELGRQQDALGRQQDALGRQQDALGRQQDALGREQDRLGREAQARFRALIADAIQRGVAQRVN